MPNYRRLSFFNLPTLPNYRNNNGLKIIIFRKKDIPRPCIRNFDFVIKKTNLGSKFGDFPFVSLVKQQTQKPMKTTSAVSALLSKTKAFFVAPASNLARFALVTLALIAGTAMASAAMVPGKVSAGEVTGEVWVSMEGGEKVRYQPGMTLGKGSIIETGSDSTITLYFSNGVRVYVQPSSTFRIDLYEVSGTEPTGDFQNISKETIFSNTKLHVGNGEVIVEANGLRAPISSLVLSSPYIRASLNDSNAALSLKHSETMGILSDVKGPVTAKDISSGTNGRESVIDQDSAFIVRFGDPEHSGREPISTADANRIKNIIANGGGTSPEPATPVSPTSRPPAPRVTPIDNTLVVTSPNGEGARL